MNDKDMQPCEPMFFEEYVKEQALPGDAVAAIKSSWEEMRNAGARNGEGKYGMDISSRANEIAFTYGTLHPGSGIDYPKVMYAFGFLDLDEEQKELFDAFGPDELVNITRELGSRDPSRIEQARDDLRSRGVLR